MAAILNANPVVHVRFDGRSSDIPLRALDMGPMPGDADVKRALSRHLGVAEARLRDYVIDRHENGNLTVRPEAVFG